METTMTTTRLSGESGVAYFLRQYRLARHLLSEGTTFTWGGWPGREIRTEEEFHAIIGDDLDRKINARGGLLAERVGWRNWSADAHWRFFRDQSRIHDRIRRRVTVTGFETRQARERFSHLLSDPREW